MKKPQILFSLSLFIAALVIYLLFTGSAILVKQVDLGFIKFPAGTLITWLGLIALPSCIYFGARRLRKPNGRFDRFLSKSLKTILILAILWVPISFLLAGNLSFSFSGSKEYQGGPAASKIFFVFTFGITVLSLMVLLLLSISTLSRHAVGKPKAADGKRN